MSKRRLTFKIKITIDGYELWDYVIDPEGDTEWTCLGTFDSPEEAYFWAKENLIHSKNP